MIEPQPRIERYRPRSAGPRRKKSATEPRSKWGIRIPPALKHGAYSATSVLPGENHAAFKKLHRRLIAEYAPSGVHEEHIVMNLARLIWRRQNLMTLTVAEYAQKLCASENLEKTVEYKNLLLQMSQENIEIMDQKLIALGRLVKLLGDTFALVDVGHAATFDGLKNELDIQEHLDASIARCLKQLLLVRGVKSMSATPTSASLKRIEGPSKSE